MSAAPIAPDEPAYVVSTDFDTRLLLVGWHPHKAEAEVARVFAVSVAHHDHLPEQPEWLNVGRVQLQASSDILAGQSVLHSPSLDAERRWGFPAVPRKWLDASTGWMRA